jgi:catalase
LRSSTSSSVEWELSDAKVKTRPAPNSHGGPRADPAAYPERSWFGSGDRGRFPAAGHDDDDFTQARTLWRDVLAEPERARLAANVAEHLSDGVDADVRTRALTHLNCIAP